MPMYSMPAYPQTTQAEGDDKKRKRNRPSSASLK